MSLEDKKNFLLFLTGSYRIPIQGMKAIKVSAMVESLFLALSVLISDHNTTNG